MCRNRSQSPQVAWNGTRLFPLVCAALWLGLSSVSAWAHKVTIFAWVEGDTVYTQSKFSGGRKVKNCTVVVYDMEGTQLLEGKTDENGEFSFKVPKKTGLKIALKASMGHLAEWTVPAEEITGAAGSFERSSPEVDIKGISQETAFSTDAKQEELPVPKTAGLSPQEVQALIDESLDRKLAPIIDMLADSLERGPTVRDVIGGIGYIFGLVGVALYFSTRGKRK